MTYKLNLLARYSLALVAVFALGFCSPDDSADLHVADWFYVLKNNNNALYRFSENDSLRVEVSVTEDSRCPAGTMCPWEGFAKVTFTISTLTNSVDLYKYESGQQPATHPSTYTFSVGEKNYELMLNDVTPYPTTENQNAEKSVEFKLKQH